MSGGADGARCVANGFPTASQNLCKLPAPSRLWCVLSSWFCARTRADTGCLYCSRRGDDWAWEEAGLAHPPEPSKVDTH